MVSAYTWHLAVVGCVERALYRGMVESEMSVCGCSGSKGL